jgi:excisionase family DNA binding protein
MKKRMVIEGLITTKEVLTLREVSEYLRVSRVTIYRLIKRKDLPAFCVGRSWRFKIEDLNNWIETGSPQEELKVPRKLKD